MPEFLLVDSDSYHAFIIAWGVLAVVSAIALYFLKIMPISSKTDGGILAKFGMINKRTGWIMMETPILATVIFSYVSVSESINASIIFVVAFVVHYINRALIFPYRLKINGKMMPLVSVFLSMAFYIINGYLIGYYFGALKAYSWAWLITPQFIIGAALFLIGFYINISADNKLMHLRKDGSSGYKIPYGGCYRLISCPNYFGEILEWLGFAIMSWCLPSTVYFLWVALPLFAQGLQTHRWYLDTFSEQYPKDRKAIIPYIL